VSIAISIRRFDMDLERFTKQAENDRVFARIGVIASRFAMPIALGLVAVKNYNSGSYCTYR
jgi:hypothetical protein